VFASVPTTSHLRSPKSIDLSISTNLTSEPPHPQKPQEELWTLLNFAAPDTFPDRSAFEEAYGDIKDQEQLQKLQAAIRPFLLRRMKEDVEKNLPPKEETIIDGVLRVFGLVWIDGVKLPMWLVGVD
jgi:hypothetical protein